MTRSFLNNVILFIVLLSCIITVTQSIKVAVLATGGPEDLGFNYQVNQAKVNAEKALNLREVYYFSDIPIPESKEFIYNLCESGYNLIIVSTLDYLSGAREAAKAYPNVQFLLRGSGATSSNIQSVTYNFISANYVTGYFAGLMTKSKIIGYVTPGPPASSNYAAHAFYVGAKNSNPDIESMYFYSTGSWLNPEISAGAANSLLSDYGVDVIGQTQDDMSVQIEAVDRGYIGIGTNGFNQKEVFGDKIALSYVLDWTSVFVDLIQKNIDHPDGNYTKTNYYGDWDNSFLTYTHSRSLDPQVKSILDEIILNFTAVPKAMAPFFCNDYNKYTFSATYLTGAELNCISQARFQNMSDPYPGMTWLGNYTIPITLKEVPKTFTRAFTATSGALILLALILEAVIYINKDKPIIRSASPIFCILIIMGGIIVYASIILWTVSPTTATCNARYWLVSIGFTTLIGSMVVKNFRIWLIFDNPELKTIKITNYQLFPWVAGLLVINALLVAIITASGDLKMVEVMGIDDLTKYQYMQVCKMNNSGAIALYILLAYFALLLLVGVFVSWKIRIVDIAEFNESKPIANTLYAISFSLFVIVSLVVSPQYYLDQQMILCIAGLFMATAALGILFVPKLYGLATRGSSTEQLFSMKKSSIASSRSSASKNSSNPDSGDSGKSSHNPHNYYKKSTNNVLAEFTDESISDQEDESNDLPIENTNSNRV
ncbi:G-protein-coupled receptor family 3 [Tieghemostelium lacteum]|uniref:G-protein-coupled receptor family 3 n=1 Tax=Tieghemostelium lacteum TaxID=361077 RepID=A0A152A9G2_TIELA|nr:G-protein-coupled receptor family 3 [Tieghemostelium lacteum]|eukprot:KYR02863.1 G-protein-coupled receptor family 3 [Tieghemostelium lacteum]